MAAKRKPAIEKPQGIVDDIIVPIAKRVLKGGTQKKALSKIASSQYKKSAKASKKLDRAAIRQLDKSSNRYKHPDAMVTSRGIRKQYKKHYQGADVGNAIVGGKSTKGVARKAKGYAPKYVAPREYGRGKR
jgi:thioesterase domain-containing protein